MEMVLKDQELRTNVYSRMRTVKFSFLFFALIASTALAQDHCPPATDGNALSTYRDSIIGRILRNEAPQVRTSLQTCFPGGVPACLRAAAEHATGSSGATATPLTLSSERDLPPQFLVPDANGNPKPGLVRFPPNLLQTARQNGWKALAYKTRSTGGFEGNDHSNLSIVAIPGAQRDVYLQIAPQDDPNHGSTHNDPIPTTDPSRGMNVLTVITVDKTQNPPVGQLRHMTYDSAAGGYRWNNSLRSSDCTRCHSNPLRPISPRGYLNTNGNERRMKPADERTVTEINDMMGVRNLTWGRGANGERLGPAPGNQPYGWAPAGSRTRGEEFIRQCSSNLQAVSYAGFGNYEARISPNSDSVDWRKISQAMDCTRCHNGEVRGSLGSHFSWNEIQFKIAVDRTMPQEIELNNNERLALLQCLRAEFSEVGDAWRTSGDWMRRENCMNSAGFGGGLLRRNNPPSSTGTPAPSSTGTSN
jgi:hypothetical protein